MTGLPALAQSDLAPTLTTLHEHARVLGAVRRSLTPRRRHWSHVTLRLTAAGLTTTPIPVPAGAVDLTLDLLDQTTLLRSSDGRQESFRLQELSPVEHFDVLSQAFESFGAKPDPGGADFSEEVGSLDAGVARDYHQVLSRLDLTLKQFAGELRQEPSPVQLFPHHFDLATSWFSGRLVPGEDPGDEDASDEQLTFGFAPPDSAIARPYVYVTAYPKPAGWGEFELASPGQWHTEGFHAAVLHYDDLLELDDPEETILAFLRAVHRDAASLMES